MMGNNGQRGGGVTRKAAASLKDNNHPPQQLLGLQLGVVGIASYSDERGKAHQNMVFVIGGQVFVAADGEKWLANNLGKPMSWLDEQLAPAVQKQLRELLGGNGGVPQGRPAQDAVDILDEDPAPTAAATGTSGTGVDPSTRGRLAETLGKTRGS